jgi:trehalose 6-phosphate synthase
MGERRKLIVVSNRGPIEFRRGENGERVVRRGSGGLATMLRSLLAHHDVTCIASVISDEDRAVAAEAGGAPVEASWNGSTYRLRLVAHEEAAFDWFYNVVANPTLWFLQHYLWDLAYAPQLDQGLYHAWEEGYVAVNDAFAGAVAQELESQPDAIVFFQDYHLYLAPRTVRDRFPDATLLHFVHIPWPQSDYWHVLHAPVRDAIHDGLLANDVIAFHTERWKRNFLQSAGDILGAHVDFAESTLEHVGRRTLVSAHPLAIDSGEFESVAASDAVLEEERRLLERRPEFLVVRVDRTDPSKNIVRGFRAFELLLEGHPELQSRVTMLAKLDPSRQDIPEYAEYLGAIQREARRVNDRFQREGWAPIELRIDDNFALTLAAYKHFDALLVNASFDGMNLIPQEASLVNERGGAVILSENAGAHESIAQYAISVNPFDVSGQAEAIYRALTMPPDERRMGIEGIREHVLRRDLQQWSEELLAEAERVTARV